MASEHTKEWKDAADLEFESFMGNETWELVKLHSSHIPTGWVFKVKHSYNSDGKVEHFKGWLVAKGCSQMHGSDNDETFSPVLYSYSYVDSRDFYKWLNFQFDNQLL